jgi:hypothetical protein
MLLEPDRLRVRVGIVDRAAPALLGGRPCLSDPPAHNANADQEGEHDC